MDDVENSRATRGVCGAKVKVEGENSSMSKSFLRNIELF